MSDEWGVIVVKAPGYYLEQLDPSTGDGACFVKEIASLAGIATALFSGLEFAFAQLVRQPSFVWFSFDGADWSQLLVNLSLPIPGIEIYARLQNDEGGELFYALPANAERVIVIWDGEAPAALSGDVSCDGGTAKSLAHWQSLIPEPVRCAFPEFVEIVL